jgi:putative phage-type endonuclease
MATVGTARLVGRYIVGSDEWLAARMQGLGGSEIAAVLGLSPYESRFSLYFRKLGEAGGIDITPEIEWGTRLEDAVAAKFFDAHPELTLDPASAGTYCHAERTWQITNPDRLYRHDGALGLLEIKTAPYGDGWGDHGTDVVPPHVRCQCVWYGDIFGLSTAHVACLIGGCDYREYVLQWDETEAVLLRDAGRQFLDEVDAGIRPDIDSHTATYQTLRDLHPDIDPVNVELTNTTARTYLAARADLTAAKDAEQHARSLVADEMGNAQAAWWDGLKIASRRAKNGGVPYVQAERNLPTPSAQGAAA